MMRLLVEFNGVSVLDLALRALSQEALSFAIDIQKIYILLNMLFKEELIVFRNRKQW